MDTLRPWTLLLTCACLALDAGAQSHTKINAPLAVDPSLGGGQVFAFEFGAGGARLLFHGNLQDEAATELWSVPFAHGAPLRLSTHATPARAAPFRYRAVPGGTQVVYWTDQESPGVHELFLAYSDGSQPPARLHSPLAGELDVGQDFVVAGGRVIYRAETSTNERFELYATRLDSSSPPVRLSGTMVPGGSVGFSDFQDSLLAVDANGTRAVYLADARIDNRPELFSVPLDGSQAPVRLSGNLTMGGQISLFQVTPDGTRVLYLADQAVVGRIELYSVPIGGGSAVRLSATPVAGGSVWSRPLVSGDGRHVVYRADALTDNEVELFSVPIDGSAAPVRLNLPMPHAGFVGDVRLARGGARVVYSADQTVDDVIELWSVPSDGSAGPVQLAGPAGHLLDVSATHALHDSEADGLEGLELYAAALDGLTPAVRLTQGLHPSDIDLVRLSPDAERVVFVRRDALGRRELFGVPFSGGAAPTRLSPPLPPGGSVPSVAFRADGAVAFLADASRRGQPALWVNDGSEARERTPDLPEAPVVGDVSAYAWSPGGTHVFYGADRFTDQQGCVTSVRLADGAECFSPPEVGTVLNLHFPPHSDRFTFLQRVVSDGFPPSSFTSLHSAPIAAPEQALRLTGDTGIGPLLFDGEGRVLVPLSNSAYRIDPSARLQLVPLDGSLPPRELMPTLGRPSFISPVALAPRSELALFGLSANHLPGGLFAAPLGVTAPAFPIDAATHAEPQIRALSVRPADELVLFVADEVGPQRHELWAVPADGSALPARLHAPLEYDREVTSVFRLSPDGARVVFRADARINDSFELFVTHVDQAQAAPLSGPMVTGGDVQQEGHFWISPDGARVVYLADQAVDEVLEFWSVPLDASARPVRLHPPLSGARDAAPTPHFTPDGREVVFALELAQDGVLELVATRTDGSGPLRVLSAPMPPGGGIAGTGVGTQSTVALSAGGRQVFYLAEQELDGVVELFSAPVDGHAAPRKWNAPLVAGGNVLDFALRPSPGALLYRADQEQVGVEELFLVESPDLDPPPRAPALPPRGMRGRTLGN